MHTNDESRLPAVPHCVSMEDRGRLTLTGVVDVDSFDEQTVTVITNAGELAIHGERLRIGRLSTEAGEMSVDGKIDALVYADPAPKSGGFFSKVFR